MTGEWIGVEERLPEKGISVLGYYQTRRNGGGCDVMSWYDRAWHFDFNDQSLYRGDTVTHWMPLPDPPERPA